MGCTIVHISFLICHRGWVFISDTYINAKQERCKLRRSSSIRYEMQFPNVYIMFKCEQIALLKGVAWVHIERERGCTRSKRNSGLITSTSVVVHPAEISNTLSSSMNSLHFCNALFVYTRKTKGEKCRKYKKRRDLHIKHEEELKARWTQVDPSQSGKPHFVKTHRHKNEGIVVRMVREVTSW